MLAYAAGEQQPATQISASCLCECACAAHLCAQACQRLAQNAAAAADIQHTQASERLSPLVRHASCGAHSLPDEATARWVERQQRRKGPAGAPPVVR